MAETKQKFSFTGAAAQQPTRQRFSFTGANKPEPLTITQSLDKRFPYRKALISSPKPQATQNRDKVKEDTERGVGLSQDRSRFSFTQNVARAIPGNSGFERSLIRNVVEPVAKAGTAVRKFVQPNTDDVLKELGNERPELFNPENKGQLQSELRKRLDEYGSLTTNLPSTDITKDTSVLGTPEFAGITKVTKNITRKALNKIIGAKTAKEATEAAVEIGVKNPDSTLINRIIKASDEKSASDFIQSLKAGAPTPQAKFTPEKPDTGPIRDNIIKRLEEPVPVGKGDVLEPGAIGRRTVKAVNELKQTPNPSISQVNNALEALRLSGRKVDDLADDLARLSRQTPDPYTQRAGAQDIRPSKRFSFTGMIDSAKQNLKDPAMSKGGYIGGVPEGFPKKQSLDNQGVSSANLSTEAAKFKSADEFIRAYENRGNTFKTAEDVANFNASQVNNSLEKRLEALIAKNDGNEIKGIQDFKNSLDIERSKIAREKGVSLGTMDGENIVRKELEKLYGPVAGKTLLTRTSNSLLKFADEAGLLKDTKTFKKEGKFGTEYNGIDTDATNKKLTELYNQAQKTKATTQKADDIIKAQPKPEQIQADAKATKEWETNPAKARAEATQKVAKEYSNTVADKGFISEASTKVEGVPPIKNTTAKARNFAKDNDVPIDLPPQTLWQYGITQIQDTAYRLGYLQKQLNKSGVKISDEANAYLQREAYIGRAASKIDKKQAELGMKAGNKSGLFPRMRKDDISVEDLAEYMSAKNAPDRNKRVASIKDGVPDGGSGLTNKEAQDILNKYKGNKKMDEYASEFREKVITPRLQLLKEAGILTQEQIDNIIKYEPNYVPAKVAEFDRIAGGDKGFSVKSSGVKGLRGSARKDRTNSVMQAVQDYEDAVQRAEKNRSLQSMGKLIEENPDKSLWEVKGVQYAPQYNEVGELQFLRQRELNPKTSVEFWKDGKAYEIRIHDEALAKVFTQEGVWKPIKGLTTINNYLRAVNTVINPEFMVTNAIRDLQTAMVTAGGEKGVVTAAKIAKDYTKASKGIWQAVRKESNTGWAKTYNEMVENGGRTGWFDLNEVEESTKRVSKMVNRYNSNKTSDALMRSIDSTGKLISDMNEVAEMSVRVSAYKQLVDGGMSKTAAANYAKNMTVNFNKKGNLGMTLNSLYLFGNASIQGSARILTAMKYPKVRRIVYGIAATSYGINELNNKINPEGYDRVQDFEKERNLIIMLPLDGNKYNIPGIDGDPSNGYYFKIPLPYGFNVFKVAGDTAYDVANKRITNAEGMKRILSSTNASFNPLSSGTAIQTASFTVTDPFFASFENKNWFGAPIMPEQPAFAPAVRDSDRYFSGARDMSVQTAQFLNRISGGNEVTAGAVDISPETIDHVIDTLGGGLGNFIGQTVDGSINTVKGDIPTPDEMPFIRKLIDTPFEKGEQSQAFEMLDRSATKLLNQIETDRFIDSVVDATVRGDIDVKTGERMFTQYQQNVARNYAGEVLSLFNEDKLDEALKLYQSAPKETKKELDKLIEDDLETEIKRLKSK